MYITELLIYFVLILSVCLLTTIHVQLRSLNNTRLILLALFTYLFVVGQVNKSSLHTYPFVTWSMYSQTYPSQTNYEFVIELEDSTIQHYPVEIITFTSQRAFMRRLSQVLQRSDKPAEAEELLYQSIAGLVKIYEEKYPSRHVQTFTINRVHISLTDTGNGFTTSTYNEYKKVFQP